MRGFMSSSPLVASGHHPRITVAVPFWPQFSEGVERYPSQKDAVSNPIQVSMPDVLRMPLGLTLRKVYPIKCQSLVRKLDLYSVFKPEWHRMRWLSCRWRNEMGSCRAR